MEVGESQRECHIAVLKRRGTFGRRRRAMAIGEDVSMVQEVEQLDHESKRERERAKRKVYTRKKAK